MGTCVHEIIANYYKKVRGQPPTVKEMKETLIMMYNHFFDPKLEEHEKEIKSLIDNFLDFETSRINNWIRPILVEGYLKTKDFCGIIDYFDGYNIIDWKTGALIQCSEREYRQGKIYQHLCTEYVKTLPLEQQKKCAKQFKVYFVTLKNGKKLEMPHVSDKWIFEQRDQKRSMITSNTFPMITSGLCNWCPVQITCEFRGTTLWSGLNKWF